MANLLDRFNKQILGSGGKIFDFNAKISPSGDFTKLKDIDVILSSWNAILLTPEGTYPFDKDFGSNLLNYIFEPADAITLENIKNEISSKLSRYDDRGTIKDIKIKYIKYKKGFYIEIEVEFEGLSGFVSATIDDNVYFNFLRQG